MIDIKLKYQAVFFLNAQDISANQTNIKNLMTQFSDKELLPSTFQELGPFLPGPAPRIRLSSTNNEWEIRFGSNRIDFEKNPTAIKGENLGVLNDFCNEASLTFNRINEIFPKKANRLALVTRFFLKEMSDIQLQEIYKKLFKASKTYSDNLPFEWNWRSVAKVPKEISEKKEDINFITSLGRTTSELREDAKILSMDRIELNFDINTSNFNTNYRFEKEEVADFFKNVCLWHDEIMNETISFIE